MPVLSAQANEVVNGDFSNGSESWETYGIVDSSGGAAVLTEDEFNFSSGLFQGIELAAGAYSLSFDYKNEPSSNDPCETGVDCSFPDFFWAVLYFSDEASFTPLMGGAGRVLMYLDSDGPYSMDGNITEPMNQGYSHFSTTFSMTFERTLYHYAFPTFELFDLNFFPGDSSTLIDNVEITGQVIPEPGTVVSMMIGLIGLAIAGRKKLLG